MIQRRTQTAAYWQDQFQVTSQDLGRIYDLILDAGQPTPVAALVRTLIDDHRRREEARIQTELARGPVYQPSDQYQVGQEITFPALDYAWGTVVGTRPARNPTYGDFVAIQVQLEGDARVREFASALHGEHPLNRKEGQPGAAAPGEWMSSDELYEAYGSAVVAKLEAALREHEEFVQFGDDWFLKELLVEINPGHLNIAEALVEVKAKPVPTPELMADLDLPAEVPEAIRLLSVKRALEADSRFDNVGDAGRDIWYLRRLAPDPVINPPGRLQLRLEPYRRQDISKELLLIEREINAEGGEAELAVPARPIYRTALVLTYPHWRSGTVPLTPRTSGLFPRPTSHYTPVILVDGQSGDRMQGWVASDGLFVYGFQEWFRRYSLLPGAVVKLERTRDPRVINVDLEPQRLRRIWVKVAVAQGEAITFENRKLPISFQFDDQMLLGEDSSAPADELEARVRERDESVLQISLRLMPELMKLSPQGTVHAKTILSAVNLLRRTPPGPLFALMSTEPGFVPMGGGYWTYDATRVRS